MNKVSTVKNMTWWKRSGGSIAQQLLPNLEHKRKVETRNKKKISDKAAKHRLLNTERQQILFSQITSKSNRNT